MKERLKPIVEAEHRSLDFARSVLFPQVSLITIHIKIQIVLYCYFLLGFRRKKSINTQRTFSLS